MKFLFRLRLPLLLCVTLLLGNTFAGTTFDWDGSAGVLWSNQDNWTPQAPVGGPQNNDVVRFPNGAANQTNTNDLAANIDLTVQFTGGNYTITGTNELDLNGDVTVTAGTHTYNGIIDLNGNRDFAISAGAQLTLPNILTGGNDVSKSGTGTLVLAGANTYTGTTSITGGILEAQSANALGTVGTNTTVTAGAQLAISGGIVSDEPLILNGTGITTTGALLNVSGSNEFSNTISLASNSSVGSTAGTLLLSDTISGSGLEKVGAGTVQLSGSNTYAGTTTVTTGVLLVTNNTGLGTTAGDTTVAAGATLQLQGGIAIPIGEDITLNGVGAGTGALFNDGNNSVAGLISLGSAAIIGSTANTLTLTGGITGTQNLTFEGAGDITVSTAALATGTGTVTKNGAGTVTLSATNTYTGLTTITAGTLQVGGSAIADNGPVTITGGNLQLLANEQIGTLTGAGSTIDLNGFTLSVNQGADATYSGIISGAATNGLTKLGANVLTLGGVNTFTGLVTLNAGTLAIVADVALGNVNTDISFTGASTLRLDAAMTLSATRDIALNAAATIDTTTSASTIQGVISGVSGLTKIGTGTLILSGTNTYVGATAINVGAIHIQSVDALGAVGVGTTVADGAQLIVSGGLTFAAEPITLGATAAGALSSTAGDNGWPGAITLTGNTTINVSADSLTLNAAMGGAFSVTKIGANSLQYGVPMTYGGATDIQDGSVGLVGTGSIPDTSNVTLAANCAVNINAINDTIGSLTMAGGTNAFGSAVLTLGGALTFNGGSTATVNCNLGLGDATRSIVVADSASVPDLLILGVVSNGGFVKTGAGELQLNGANTHAVVSALGDGTLSLGNDAALGMSTFTINGGTVQATAARTIGNAITVGGDFTIGGAFSIFFTNTVDLGAAARQITLTGFGVPTFQNVISGTGGLTFTSATTGFVHFTAANTYGNGTTLTNIRFTIGNAAAFAGGTVTINSGCRLDAAGSFTLASGLIVNADFEFQTALGFLVFNGDVALGNAVRTITVSGGNPATLGGVISNTTGGLTKAGTGVLVLAGNNTYTGPTAVNEGTLRIATANERIPNGSAVTLADTVGAVLDLNDFDETVSSLSGGGAAGGNVLLGIGTLTTGNAGNQTYAGVISDGGGLTKIGGGIFTLTGTNTYTGATTLTAGTLLVNGSLAAGSAVGVAAGTTLGGNGTVAGAITVTGAAFVSPGASSGATAILNTGGVTLNTDAEIIVELNNTTAGTGHDRIAVTGTIDLNDVNLSGTVGAGVTLGNAFTIITATAVNGLINGVTDGSTLVLDGRLFTVNYTATTVILTRSAGTFTWTGTASGSWINPLNWNQGLAIPGQGDSLIFPGTAVSNIDAMTNDLLGSPTFVNITFNGDGGYTLGGSAVAFSGTLTGSSTTGTNAIDVALNGAGAVIINGVGGTTAFNGANGYTGATTITNGTLVAGNATALGTTAGGTTLNPAAGTAVLQINGVSIGAEALTFNSGGGTATLENLVGTTTYAGPVTLTTAGTVLVTAGQLTLNGLVSGLAAGTLTKTGAGTLVLGNNANDYAGVTNITAGIISATVANALGASGAGQGTTVTADATLEYSNNITVAEPLGVDGLGVGSNGALQNLSGANTQSGTVVLSGATRIGGAAGSLNISGVLSGNFALTKLGAATIRISGNNNARDGSVVVNEGTLEVAGGNAIGNTEEVTVTSGTLSLINDETIGSLDGAAAGLIALGANTLSISQTAALTYAGVISGTGNVTLIGSANLTLTGNNAYGTTTLNGTAGNTLLTLNRATGALSDTGPVVMTSGNLALLQNETIGNLSGASDINLNTFVLTVNEAGSTTYNGIISSTGAGNGLTKIGLGTLTLGGANTFDGLTTVDTGSLTLGASNVLVGAVTVQNTGQFAISTFSDTVGAVTLMAGSITGTGGTLTGTVYDVRSGTISAILDGAVALNKTTAGTVVLSGANTYTGLTTVNDGILQLAGGAALLDSGSVTVTTGTLELNASETIGTLSGTGGGIDLNTFTLTVNQGADGALASVISDSGNLIKSGTFRLELNANNSFTGTTTLTAGTLRIGNAGALDNSSSVTINAGTLDVFVAGASINTLSGLAAGIVELNANTLTIVQGANGAFAGVIQGTGGILKQGGSILTLSGANTFSGLTTVDTGILALGASNVLVGAVTVQNTGEFAIAGNSDTVGAVTLTAGTISGTTGTLMGSVYNVESGTVSAILDGGAVVLNKSTAGVVFLTNANMYGGITNITAGVLEISNANGLGTTAGATLVSANATLRLSGGITLAGETITLNGTGAGGVGALFSSAGTNSIPGGSITLGSDSSIGVAGGTILTIGADIASGVSVFSLTKINTGELIVQGNNTWLGTTTITDGILRDNSVNNAIPDGSAVTVNNIATAQLILDHASVEAIGSLAGGLAGSVGVQIINGATLQTGDATNTAFNGIIAGANGLGVIKVGMGSFTLNDANTFAGTLDVQVGSVILGASERLNDTIILRVSGGTFNPNSFTETVTTLNLINGTISAGVLTATSAYNVEAGTINANLANAAGTVPLNKSTVGLVVLNGTNTYTGETNVNAGTLEVNNGAAIPDTSPVIILAAGTMDGNGVTETIGELSGAGNVSLNDGTLTINEVNPTTFSGAINGAAGNVIKTGAATLTLIGANTFTGTLSYLSGSTVLINASNVLADAASVNLNILGATFNLADTFSDTIGVLDGIAGTTVGIAAGSNLTVGFNDVSNTAFAGTLGSGIGTFSKIGAAPGTWTNTGTVNVGALVVGGTGFINNNAAITVAGAITGATGTLVQNSAAATLTITGTGHNVLLNAAFAGNLVTYNGAAQTLITPSTSYSDLTLAGSGIKDTSGGFTIGDDLDVQGGVTFNLGTFSYNLAGDLTNAGTFSPQTSTVTLNGIAAQTFTDLTPADRLDLNNLTVNNTVANNIAVVLAVDTDLRVSGNLVLNNGSINVGAGGNIVDITSTAAAATSFNRTGTGHIYSTAGTATVGVIVVRKAFATGNNQTISFHVGSDPDGYTPADVGNLDITVAGTLSAGTSDFARAGALGVSTPTTGGLDSNITRFWTVTNTGITLNLTDGGYNTTLTFLATDVGTTNPTGTDFVVRRFDGIDWFTTARVSSTGTSVTASNIISFSDFACGNDATPSLFPTIVSGTRIAVFGNSTFDVLISEDVFTTQGPPATGALTPADFRVVVVSQATPALPTGRVVSATVQTVTLLNSPPAQPVYRLVLNLLDGANNPVTAAGTETVQIFPFDGNSIFDSASNAMAATQSTAAIPLVDETSPFVLSVTAPVGGTNSAYVQGNTITFTVNFSEPVQFSTLAPTLSLALDSGVRNAALTGATINTLGTTYTFAYTVVAGDFSVDLDYLSANSIVLNGGTIRDAAANDLADGTGTAKPPGTNQMPAPAAVGSLRQTSSVDIDAADPVFAAPLIPAAVTTPEDTAFTVIFGVSDNITDTRAPGTITLTPAPTSSNTALIPNANIVINANPSNTQRSLTITPLPNTNGTANITVTLLDGVGRTSVSVIAVTVSAVNDNPVIAFGGGAVTFTENGSSTTPTVGIAIDSTATATDVDTNAALNQTLTPPDHFTPGTLTVTLTNSESFDRLLITNEGGGAGQVGAAITSGAGTHTLAGSLTFGGTAIGTYATAFAAGAATNVAGSTTVSVIPGTLTLTVTFAFAGGTTGAQAYAAAQGVMRNVLFLNDSERPFNDPNALRSAAFVLVDRSGGTSNTVSKTISVIEVDDALTVSQFAAAQFDNSPLTSNPEDTVVRDAALPILGAKAGTVVSFSVAATEADDNLTFLWDFADGTSSGTTAPVPPAVATRNATGSVYTFSNAATHQFTKAGQYRVTVRISSGRGTDVTIGLATVTITHNSAGTAATVTTAPANGTVTTTSGVINVNTPPRITNTATVTLDTIFPAQDTTITFSLPFVSTLPQDQDLQNLTFTVDFGDDTSATFPQDSGVFTLNGNILNFTHTYRELPTRIVPNADGSLNIPITITVKDQQTVVPEGVLVVTSVVTFANPIIGAADTVDVFNPTAPFYLGLHSASQKGGGVRFTVVGASPAGPLKSVTIFGPDLTATVITQTTKVDKASTQIIREGTVINGNDIPSDTYNFGVNFGKGGVVGGKPGVYIIEVVDADGSKVSKLYAVTSQTIAGNADPATQDVNVATSFVTGKLRFNDAKDDLLTFRGRFPFVNTVLAQPVEQTFNDKIFEFEAPNSKDGRKLTFTIGLGNFIIFAEATGNTGKVTAVYTSSGIKVSNGEKSLFRFKRPKSTIPRYTPLVSRNGKTVSGKPQLTHTSGRSEGLPNKDFQSVLDLRINVKNASKLGLASEGVVQSQGGLTENNTTVFDPVDNLLTSAQEAGDLSEEEIEAARQQPSATREDSRVFIQEGKGGKIQFFQHFKPIQKDVLKPLGIQIVLFIDNGKAQLVFASKLPAGFVVRNGFGQLAGKK